MKKFIQKAMVTSVAVLQVMAFTNVNVLAEPVRTRIVVNDTVVFVERKNGEKNFFDANYVPSGTEVKLVGEMYRRDLKYVTKYTNDNLNLRKSPNDGEVLLTIPVGNQIAVLEEENGWAKVIYNGIQGYVSEEYLTNDHIVGSYSTPLSGNPNNTTNISVASKFINNKIVKAGETFSYLDAIGGESTPELGYKEATVIVNGKRVQGIGGGVCQVSSTLYAAIKSIPNQEDVVEINERYPHTSPVGYISRELEATVWFPSKDLKFTPKCDIKIISHLEGGRVYVDIVKL